ncbi:hypothetical protein [Mucisphaera calidilacus]|uniref:hypothetical protein n=1 Tax=Mucisphaera calidilacus TaxID=2527982 RepID=UPI0011A365C5|nr:hypothetical protein [Mucisphaera calidilacus]
MTIFNTLSVIVLGMVLLGLVGYCDEIANGMMSKIVTNEIIVVDRQGNPRVIIYGDDNSDESQLLSDVAGIMLVAGDTEMIAIESSSQQGGMSMISMTDLSGMLRLLMIAESDSEGILIKSQDGTRAIISNTEDGAIRQDVPPPGS